VVRAARDLHRGTIGQGLALKAATQDVRWPRRFRDVSREANPGALHQAGRRIFASLPVGTGEKVLRRPVSGIFRQKDGQFLLPPRGWVSHSPEMATKCWISARITR